MRNCSLVVGLVVCFSACSSTPEVEPSGPIARLGTAPVIDGVFDSGEWDDAEVVRTGTVEQFRMKHDRTHLYLAVNATGGDLVFNTDAGLRVLHWSAQLGSAEYVKSDTSTQSLDKPFAYELWGLHQESPAVVRETLARYLDENGWVANNASVGELNQSELVVAFDWLGVNLESGQFVELPGVRIRGGLMISRDDPRAAELLAMPLEELERLYPPLSWPTETEPADSIGMGSGLPDTIRIDPADYGAIWIDTRR